MRDAPFEAAVLQHAHFRCLEIDHHQFGLVVRHCFHHWRIIGVQYNEQYCISLTMLLNRGVSNCLQRIQLPGSEPRRTAFGKLAMKASMRWVRFGSASGRGSPVCSSPLPANTCARVWGDVERVEDASLDDSSYISTSIFVHICGGADGWARWRLALNVVPAVLRCWCCCWTLAAGDERTSGSQTAASQYSACVCGRQVAQVWDGAVEYCASGSECPPDSAAEVQPESGPRPGLGRGSGPGPALACPCISRIVALLIESNRVELIEWMDVDQQAIRKYLYSYAAFVLRVKQPEQSSRLNEQRVLQSAVLVHWLLVHVLLGDQLTKWAPSLH